MRKKKETRVIPSARAFGNPVKSIEKIRKCKICGKRLSVYNKTNECYCHNVIQSDEPGFDSRPWEYGGIRIESKVARS